MGKIVMENKKIVDLVRRKHLFDEEFYYKAYGHYFLEKSKSWIHFASYGINYGFKPSKKFDPVLVKIAIFCLKKYSKGSCKHFLEVNQKKDEIKKEIFPELYGENFFIKNILIKIVKKFKSIIGKRRKTNYRTKIKNNSFVLWEESSERIEVGGKNFWIVSPNPEKLMSLFDKKGIKFVRFPHGHWDALEKAESVIGKIEKKCKNKISFLNYSEKLNFASRVCEESYSQASWGGFSEGFLHEVVVKSLNKKYDPNFIKSLSFKGEPTWKDKVFDYEKRLFDFGSLKRRRDFLQRFMPEETQLWDASIWKRHLLSGGLANLPDKIKNKKVVLVGPSHLSSLQDKWGIEVFDHIIIPGAKTQQIRFVVLKKIVESINKYDNLQDVIVLFQCGASLAFWFSDEIDKKFSEVSCVDMGQALDGWFLDDASQTVGTWSLIYKDLIKTKNKIDVGTVQVEDSFIK